MIRLLLLRHAQTPWNAEGRWQGWADVPLSDEGRQHANLVGGELVDFDFVKIIASDLQRARETTEILNRHLLLREIEFHAALRERGVGQWSGKTASEIDSFWPGERAQMLEDRDYTPPDGESRVDLIARIEPAIQTIADDSLAINRAILIVTHGGVIRNVARHLDGDCGPLGNLDGLWLTGSSAEDLKQDGVFRPVNSGDNPPITSL